MKKTVKDKRKKMMVSKRNYAAIVNSAGSVEDMLVSMLSTILRAVFLYERVFFKLFSPYSLAF
jgi:hypothetical protein